MTKNQVQEKLVALYLRLNGYTTTGLILHSPDDRAVQAEIDIIGVRFVHHSQPDRVIGCSEELHIPGEAFVDIIIGEVKGGNEPLQFNDSMRNHPDRMIKLLRWIGVIRKDDLPTISQQLSQAVQNPPVQNAEPLFPVIEYDNLVLRPILFGPDKTNQRPNQRRFINGTTMINYCWACFRPENRRLDYETNYRALNNWGEQFEKMMGYFKNHDRATPGTIQEIYKHFGVTP